jgi:4-hydroxybenzoate polyprenyltransferase
MVVDTNSRRVRWVLLLGAIRWYNMLLLALAQYIIAFFVFGEDMPFLHLLLNRKLHLIVLSTSFAVAGAFLVNAFYDTEKDLVNHPKIAVFSRLLGQNFLLNSYAAFNVLAILTALLASLKVFLFVSGLVFLFWFYSHKLQKIPVFREISASVLALAPLIAVWLHFATMHYGMVIYLGSLFLLEFTREVVKDLEGNKGNIIFGYKTVVVAAGSDFAKNWLFLFNLLCAGLWVTGSLNFPHHWGYYSSISLFSVLASQAISLTLRFSRNESFYPIADTLLKTAIVIHLLSPVVRVWM